MTDPTSPPPDERTSRTAGRDGDDARDYGVSERFRDRAADATRAGTLELLPSRLAAVTRDVLGSDGAGLSLFSDEFRLPLGSSDDEAAAAERLQFTVAEGPCWQATRDDVPLAVDEETIRRRWPLFGAELRRRTPFRSVASVPLRLARSTGGALDLYFRGADAAPGTDLGGAVAVAAHIADILNRVSLETPPPDEPAANGPRWARGPAARSRNGVWIAAGMLVGGRVAQVDDAMALLRSTAFAEERSVEAVASELVEGRRSPDDLS